MELCFSVKRHHMFIILHTSTACLSENTTMVTMATYQPRNEQTELILMRICKLAVAVKLSL